MSSNAAPKKTETQKTSIGPEFRDGFDKKRVVMKQHDNVRVHYNPSEAPHALDTEETMVLSPTNAEHIPAKRSFLFQCLQTIGVLGSIAWIALCVFYFILEGGFVTQTPYEMGIFVAGMISPIAFFWMILSYMQRNTDVRYYAESMRSELHSLFFPSDEDSARVNRDIERMALQAAELASSSKAALKAIHRTRQALHHEIKEFSAMAEKTESHMLMLSDKMLEKTGTLGALTETIEERIETIANKSENSIKSWDDVSVRMIERASDIEVTMDKGASRILSMADVAEEKSKVVAQMFDGTITSLGLTVDAVIDRLNGINDNFGTYTHTLSRSSEELSKETGRLGAMFDDQIEQLNAATGRTVETITQSLIEVGNQKQALDDSALDIERRVSAAANTITESVHKMDNVSTTIATQADSIASRLSEKAEDIATSLNNLDEQIERIDSVSELANHRLAEGIDTAVNGSTQVSESIRRGVDVLVRASDDATKNATKTIADLVTHVESLQSTSEESQTAQEQMVSLLTQSREQIEKASRLSQAHIATLQESVKNNEETIEKTGASLADQIRNVSNALEGPVRKISLVLADVDGRHEQIQTTLDRRISELNAAGEKATHSLEVMRRSLQEQTTDIGTFSGNIVVQAKTLNDELNETRENFKNTATHTLSNLTNLIEKVDLSREDIQEVGSLICQSVSQVSDKVDLSLSRLQDGALLAEKALGQASEGFVGHADNLENKLDGACLKIEGVTKELAISSEKILPIYHRLENDSERALNSMQGFYEQYTHTAETVKDAMDVANNRFESSLSALQEGAKSAVDDLNLAGKSLTVNMQDMTSCATNADETLRELNKAINAQSLDMSVFTDQAIVKVESVQNAIKAQLKDLSVTVDQAVTDVDGAGDKFEKRTARIMVSTEDVLGKFKAIGDGAETTMNRLKETSQNVSVTAHQVVEDVSKEMETLDKNSEKALLNLRKTGETLSMKSKEIDATMDSVVEKSKNYSADIRSCMREIGEQSQESSQVVVTSLSSLLSTMDDVDGKVQSVLKTVHSTNQSLYDQSGRFVTAVSKSAEAAQCAADMFSRQSDQLLKSSEIAVEKSQNIRDAEVAAGRDLFMSSARYVLESLHSLSVDFVRTIEGTVSDKDWKSYQNGDIALFTTHLVKILDSVPADKIRNKYAEDGEFRIYVQKFMRQYEDVLSQADTVDRGAILGTVFAASDVGKIYRFLSNVTGRATKAKAA